MLHLSYFIKSETASLHFIPEIPIGTNEILLPSMAILVSLECMKNAPNTDINHCYNVYSLLREYEVKLLEAQCSI